MGPRVQTHSKRQVHTVTGRPELPLTGLAALQEEFNLSLSGFPDEIGRRGQCAHAAECGRTGSARRPLHAVSGTQEMPPASAAPPQGLSAPSPGGAAPVPQNEPCGKKRVTGGESPGPRHPQASAGPAPPRPWPPSSSHLGSPLLLPSSPALCSPKDRASPSHDSHCPASSLPGLCMGGLTPALPTHAATPATSAGGARDARPTTWPQAPLTDKAYSSFETHPRNHLPQEAIRLPHPPSLLT